MKILKTTLLFVVTIVTLTVFNSCGIIVKSMANKHLTEDRGAIPPDFGKDNSTVIFITHHKSYNRYMKKNVKKIYKGNYEFATEEEFNTEDRFKDIDTYRYVFDYDYIPAGSTWKSNTKNSGGYSITTTTVGPASYQVKKFFVVDRKKEKVYKSDMTSSFWSKLQKVYLKKLNEKLAKN